MMTSKRDIDMMSISAANLFTVANPFQNKIFFKIFIPIFRILMDFNFPDGFSGYKIVTKQFKDKI